MQLFRLVMIKHGQNWNSQFTETESALKPNVGGKPFAKKPWKRFKAPWGILKTIFLKKSGK